MFIASTNYSDKNFLGISSCDTLEAGIIIFLRHYYF